MREEEKRARLQRMRFVALAALLAMLIAFVASSIWQHAIPAFQWLRAFAEAGVAEAIAGSYAVVALFRTSARFAFAAHRDHPGKQGPHRRKRWGFIETNFLTAENVGEKLERLDLAASASESLREPANARNLADALCDLVPPALETVEDAEIRTFVDRGSRTLDDDGHRQGSRSGGPQEVLLWLRDWMSSNRDAIKIEFGRVSRYTPGFLDAYIVNRFVEGIAHLLEEAAEDPDHQIWQEMSSNRLNFEKNWWSQTESNRRPLQCH